MGSVFGSGSAPKVQAAPPKKVNISAGVAQGMLIQKTTPMYPPIAKAARVSGHGGDSGDDLQDRNDRESARRQRSGHVAAGGPGCSEDLALSALPAQQRARRSGDHGQRDLHSGRIDSIFGPFPQVRKGLAFDLNANPERAAFPIAKPGMMHPEATTLHPTRTELDLLQQYSARIDSESVAMNEADQESVSLVLSVNQSATTDSLSSQTP